MGERTHERHKPPTSAHPSAQVNNRNIRSGGKDENKKKERKYNDKSKLQVALKAESDTTARQKKAPKRRTRNNRVNNNNNSNNSDNEKHKGETTKCRTQMGEWYQIPP